MNKIMTAAVLFAALFITGGAGAHTDGHNTKKTMYGQGQVMTDETGYHIHKSRPYWHKHVNGKVITPKKENARERRDLRAEGFHNHKSRPYWHKHVNGKVVVPGCNRYDINLASEHCHNDQDIRDWRVSDSAKTYKVELPKKMKLVPHDAGWLAVHDQWRD